ncbi:MAG: hypothetical protein HC831_16545 [Chloroflexia bacterium]|nr:hypothetical protein [Chloroflexia bacterium]
MDKVSRYTFGFVSSTNQFLIYNSRSNNFIRVNKDILKIIQESKIRGDNSLFSSFDTLLMNKFKQLKIIVDNQEEEQYLLNLEMQHGLETFSSNRIILVLAPTTHCNFSCSYCFEKIRRI